MTEIINIPFSTPVVLPEHKRFVREALTTGHMSGMGVFTRKCERLLEAVTGRPTRVVTSATHALEMMALLLEIGPGDEVICPSFTFVSTANAFALRGAQIRFADNDAFGNILPSEIERLITPKTKAVIAVDYAGASADLDVIREICDRRRIAFLEDSAQSIGAAYKGKPLGSQADLACLSFHETKNIGCGEGGALIFGTDKHVERAEILREKGTNRTRFFQGLVDKYTWVDLGSSYVLSELNTAYLQPQLETLQEITAKRGKIWKTYESELREDFHRKDITILGTPAYNTPNYHIFGLIFPRPELRRSFIEFLDSRKIRAPFHYVSLHLSPYGSRFHTDGRRLPGCERLSNNLVRLPVYFNMTDHEQAYTISAIREWLVR